MTDLTNVAYDTQIPNNVGLSSDGRILKALEKWHPGYLKWWNDLGPDGFQDSMSICAPPSASIPRAGPSSTM